MDVHSTPLTTIYCVACIGLTWAPGPPDGKKKDERSAPNRPSKSKITTTTGNAFLRRSLNLLLSLLSAFSRAVEDPGAEGCPFDTIGLLCKYAPAVKGTAFTSLGGVTASAIGDHSTGSADQKEVGAVVEQQAWWQRERQPARR